MASSLGATDLQAAARELGKRDEFSLKSWQEKLQACAQNQAVEVLVVSDAKEALLAAQAAGFAGRECFVLPDFRAQKGDDLNAFSDELNAITATLGGFYKASKTRLLIAPQATLTHKLPSPKNLAPLVIKKGQKLDLKEVKERLLNFGYEFGDIVVEPAEARVSGEVIDIFSPSKENPVRILTEFDEVESIREFDAATQKNMQIELDEVEILPFLAELSTAQRQKLEKKAVESLTLNFRAMSFWEIEGFIDLKEEFCCAQTSNFFENIQTLHAASRFKPLQVSLSQEFCKVHKERKILVLSTSLQALNALNLEASNIAWLGVGWMLNLTSPQVSIISLNTPPKMKRKKSSNIVLDELRAGELVVHENYGVGKFLGLELAKVLGVKREVVAIAYQNGDKLLLPVEHLDKIDKYIASSGVITQLDRLGKASFAKIKESVRKKLFVIAAKIAELAAKRELINAPKLSLSPALQNEFNRAAGFAYTPDQEDAIGEILSDLQSGKAMERLLSGDVGFGKTEVAMNAILACVKSGYSALFFAPTTLLSNQHYASLKARLTPFGVEVFKLDRFSTAAQKRELKEAIEANRAICVVGTHALLSLRVENTALVVIDEEHKFGVKQKEKLKLTAQNAHILTMSATPIPRSLNMALSGVKSYSVLLTPPLERLATRSFVREWDEAVVKEAILREIRRGGQCIFVHNKIADLSRIEKELKRLLPSLKIAILHGKIEAKFSEEVMLQFAQGKFDLLLCTSIVESGIDLANVNTILVNGAQNFGLADLHQLRGRVGRRDRQGYCYFLVTDAQEMTMDARKRLVALESNSSLGSGAVLARHDLEIRGGGNLLGEEQSGNITAVGYSLYLKMVEEALNLILNRGNACKEGVEIKMNVNAFINSELVSSDRVRLELYRRLGAASSVGEVFEIAVEIEERFGRLDLYTQQFLELMKIKILAAECGFTGVSSYEQNILLISPTQKVTLKARSSDEDDVLACALEFLRKRQKENAA